MGITPTKEAVIGQFINGRNAQDDFLQLADNHGGTVFAWIDSAGVLRGTFASGVPGGSNTDVQINDNGDLGGDGGFTYDKTAHIVALTNPVAATAIISQDSPSLQLSHDWWSGTSINDTWTIVATTSAGVPGLGTVPALSIADNIGAGQSFILVPHNIWVGTSIVMAASAPIEWTGGGQITVFPGGQIYLHNSDSSGNAALIFGTNLAALSTKAALFARDASTTLHVRLGDDSADAPLTASSIALSGAITAASVATTRIVDAEPSLTFAGSVTITGSVAAVRGNSTVSAATTIASGFLYGTQGKLTIAGTLSSANMSAGLVGQLDLSAATALGSGNVAAIWGDMGATLSAGAMSGQSVLDIVLLTNTAPGSMINSVLHVEALATYLLDISNISYNPFLSKTAPGTAYGRIAVNTPDGVKYIGVYNA